MAENLKIQKLKFVHEDELKKGGKFFYPSVECGPICNKKSKIMLGMEYSSID